MVKRAKSTEATGAPAFAEGVSVLVGPAGSGKTAAALELYAHCQDDIGQSSCLLIVPNNATGVHLRRLLLERSKSGVLVSPAVITFAALAAGVLSRAGSPPSTLSAVGRRLLLSRIVAELHHAGRLQAIGALADAPGLVTALDQAIAELKRAAVEPATLAQAIPMGDARNQDLLAVYAGYQQHLLSTGRFDVEGQMWLARDVLARDPNADLGYDNLTAIAVDGFTDFTPTQLAMLAALSRRVKTMRITLPLEDSPARRRLWFWTQRTLQRLLRAMPQARVVRLTGTTLATLFDLTHPGKNSTQPIRVPSGRDRETEKEGDRKKDKDTEEEKAERTDELSIAVLEAPDVEAEVRAVARAIKAELLAGAAVGSIAVLARRLDEYAEPIERIFAEYGVPAPGRARPLSECGVIRFLLRVLALPPEYAFHDLLAALQNSYFRPQALGDFSGADVATAEMAMRTANVLGGRKGLAEAIARLSRRLSRRGQGEQEGEGAVELGPLLADADGLARAGRLVEALMSRLDALASSTTVGAYVERVRGLVAALQLASAACDQDEPARIAADLRALREFGGLLDELAQQPAPAGEALPAERMAPCLAQAAAVAACPPARGETLVAVLDVLDARALRFRRTYLLGLHEKSFPQLSPERCFIDESDRAAWSERGLPLDRRSDLLGREMLLFYLAATRAPRLHVSYVSADSSGQARTPSVFLEELKSAAGREGVPCSFTRIRHGDFLPAREHLACGQEVLASAVWAAFHPDRATEAPELLGWIGRNCPELLGRASFGLLASHRRWRKGTVDAFDGRLDDPRLLASLAERFPGGMIFSATELNAYARCPWQFFARWLLHLEPLEEPSGELTAADRGSFCHAVLWRLFTDLSGKDRKPVRLAEIEEGRLREGLVRAVQAERARWTDSAVYVQLWNAQTEYWERLLWSYLRERCRKADAEARAIHFELGFGVADWGDGRRDPASRDEPVEIDVPGHRIRVRGKIDRVDTLKDGSTLAVDYKSGRAPGSGDILDGLDFQLALYVKALEAMFKVPCAGGEYHGLRDGKVRSLTRTSVPKRRGEEPPSYEAVMELLMAKAGACIDGMRAGRFDALPRHKCPDWCPYGRICHYSEARARQKLPPEGERGDGDE